MAGWVKLHRQFISWEWFDTSDMVKLFIFLLLSANHDSNTWRGVNIERGQYLTGLNSLSDKTKISIQTLRTCLKRLEKTGEINTQVTNKYRLITVCNYDSYQDNQQATNKQTNKQLTINQQATNNKQEEKELKEEKETYIYNQFYDEQLKLSDNNQSYEIFIKWLFGNNILERILDGVLKMREQMNFKQFKSLEKAWLELKDDSTVEQPKIQELLVSMENWVVKDNKNYKTTVAGMLRTFLKRNTKKVKQW